MRDRRGARSLNIPSCRLPIYNADKQLDVWDVLAKPVQPTCMDPRKLK